MLRASNVAMKPETSYKSVLLLVPTPLGSSFQSIVRAVGRKPPQNPSVEWESHDNRALPDVRPGSDPPRITRYA